MQETLKSPIADEKKSPLRWIINPLLDYLFVAGGLFWILWGLTFAGMDPNKTDPSNTIFAAVLYWGSLLITDVHGPATLGRVYTSKTTPKKVRTVVTVAGILLISLGIPCLTNMSLIQAFTKVTLLWAVQHYTAQTYGVVMIYCLKNNFALDSIEKLVIQNLLRAQLLFVWVRAFTLTQFGGINFLGIQVPFWGPLPMGFMLFTEFFLVLMCMIFVITFTIRLITSKELLPLPAILSIVTVIAITMLARDNSNYMIGVTFYHSSQYLAITYSYYLREKALEKSADAASGWHLIFARNSIIYYLSLLALGYCISNTLPNGLFQINSQFPMALATVYCVFNCHHFFTDALVWRIRDPKIRQILV